MKVNKKLSATILAAIMVLSVITMIPIGAVSTERTYTDTGGVITITTDPIDPKPSGAVKVFIGEEMTFSVDTVNVDGPYDGEGNPKPGCGVSTVSTWDTTLCEKGFYKVVAAGVAKKREQGWATIDEQKIKLKLDPSAMVVEEGTVNLEITTNKDGGFYEIKIKDEEDSTVHSADVRYDTTKHTYEIDTDAFDLDDGKYDIYVKDKATEVEKTIRLTVKEKKLDVDAPDEVILGKSVKIKIKSAYSKKEISITIKECPEGASWEWGDGTPNVTVTGTTEKDGDWSMKWKPGIDREKDLGTYEFEVEVEGDEEEFEIEVVEGEITVSVPEMATIGEKVKITGSTALPDATDIDILIEGRYWSNIDPDSDEIYDDFANIDIDDGIFEEIEWDTRDMTVGSYTITAFWDEDGGNDLDPGEDIRDVTAISLLAERIWAELVNPEISTEDTIEIEGTTTGDPSKVRVIIAGRDIVAYCDVGVHDNEFSKEISVSLFEWYNAKGKIADPDEYKPGDYDVVVIHPMSDKKFYLLETTYDLDGDGTAGTENDRRWNTMTVIARRGLDTYLGSIEGTADDQASARLSLTIAYSYLIIDVPPEVIREEELKITGDTNREDGTVFIVRVTGYGIDETETPKAENGMVEAAFDTSDWPIGTNYLVTMEDVDYTVSQEARFNVLSGLPAAISVKSVSVEPTRVAPGDNVTITVTVKNTGDLAADSGDICITISNTEIYMLTAPSVLVPAHDTATTPVMWTAPEEGTVYTIEADGVTASLEVTGAEFELSDLKIEPEKVDVNENVTITVNVTNVGTTSGTATVTLKVNDVEVESKDVTVAANATETVTFTRSEGEKGDYTVEVDGQTGTFKVPGFEAVFAIVGLLAVAYLVMRRRRKE
jgi:PGF-CTERM protein